MGKLKTYKDYVYEYRIKASQGYTMRAMMRKDEFDEFYKILRADRNNAIKLKKEGKKIVPGTDNRSAWSIIKKSMTTVSHSKSKVLKEMYKKMYGKTITLTDAKKLSVNDQRIVYNYLNTLNNQEKRELFADTIYGGNYE